MPLVSAESWVIYDIQKKSFVKGRKELIKREVASITKMMTFYTALQLMKKFDLDDETLLTVSKEASRVNGTSADLREGD